MKNLFIILLVLEFASLRSQTTTVTSQEEPGKKKSVMTIAKRKQFLPTCSVGANNLRCDIFAEEVTFTLVSNKQESASGWVVTAKAPEQVSLKITFSEKPVVKIYEIVEQNPSAEYVLINLNSTVGNYTMKPGGKVFVNQGASGFYNITICGFMNVPDKAPKEFLAGLVVPQEN